MAATTNLAVERGAWTAAATGAGDVLATGTDDFEYVVATAGAPHENFHGHRRRAGADLALVLKTGETLYVRNDNRPFDLAVTFDSAA